MIRQKIFAGLTAALLGSCLLAALSCYPLNRMENPDAGKTVSFNRGEPNFDMEVIELARDSTFGVDLYLRIPGNSLVFVKREAYFEAIYEVRIRFTADQDGDVPIDVIWSDSVRTVSPGERRPGDETVVYRRYELRPGLYLADVWVEDLNTGVTANRRQKVRVIDTASRCPAFTRIRLECQTAHGRTPYLPIHIPVNVDSLRALVSVYHPTGLRNGIVRATLLRFPTDSLVAIPPYSLSPTAWSIRSRGVDLAKACTLWTVQLQITGDTSLTLSFDLRDLQKGLHEFVVDGTREPCGRQEVEEVLGQRRYLCMVDRDFPRLTTLGQLIEVLPYLTRKDEYKVITSATDDRLRLFEKFWLDLGGDAEKARNLMRTYYTRAEEANLLFSNYKEGWKTDRGMVYIVCGPPSLVEREFANETWTTSSGYRFVFERVRRLRPDEPFENFVLFRDAGYENAWIKEVDRWRRGVVF